MISRERIKDFGFRLKIFMWYLFTEPVRQFSQVFKFLYLTGKALNKAMTWIYIFTVTSIYVIIKGDRKMLPFMFIMIIVAVLLYEWQSGYFMYRWRQKIRKKIGGNKK